MVQYVAWNPEAVAAKMMTLASAMKGVKVKMAETTATATPGEQYISVDSIILNRYLGLS